MIAPETRFALSAGYGWFNSKLDTLRPTPVLPGLPLLGTKSILFVTEAQPQNTFTLQASLTHGRFDAQTNRSEEHPSELQSLMRTSYPVFSLPKHNNIIHKK